MLKVAAFSLLVLCVHSAPVPADKAEKISHVALEKPEFVVIHMSAPKFLEDATPEGRKKFAEIILGAGKEDKTIQQIFDALNEWAKAQGPQVEAAYGKTKDKVKAAVADVRTAIAKSKLSDGAKQGFAKIGAVLANRDQTQTQVYTKVHEILEALPKGVKKEMNEYTESVAEEALLKLKAQVATGSA